MLVPLCFIIISVVFFYRGKLAFSGFLEYNGYFVHEYYKEIFKVEIFKVETSTRKKIRVPDGI